MRNRLLALIGTLVAGLASPAPAAEQLTVSVTVGVANGTLPRTGLATVPMIAMAMGLLIVAAVLAAAVIKRERGITR